MSDFKHRNVKELKSFIKKYNDHFRIMLTGKKKADLVKEINEGMKKTVDDKLKKDYDMLTLKPIKSKPLKKPVDKPKSEPPTMIIPADLSMLERTEQPSKTFEDFLQSVKTKPDPDLDKGIAGILGVKK